MQIRPSKTQTSRRLASFLWIAAVLVLPNLPLLVSAHPLSLLLPGYVDLDYLIVGMLALFLPRAVTAFLLTVAILLDLMYAACVTYFFAPSEFLNAIRFSGLLSTTRIGTLIAAFVLMLAIVGAVIACVPRHPPALERRNTLFALLGLALLLALVSSIAARLTGIRSHEPAADTALVRVPTLTLALSQEHYWTTARGTRLGGQFAMPSAAALALHHLGDFDTGKPVGHDNRANLVLILVESWGYVEDAPLRRALMLPYADPAILTRYTVEQGTMPFAGSTTAGEARELCQSHLGLDATHGTPNQWRQCLPMQLAAKGYRTVAMHGFYGSMFDREQWYPKFGFQDIYFHDRLHAQGLPDCPGPFVGTCDAAIAHWLAQQLQAPQSQPMFVHWVTLNSHLPVPVPAPLSDPASCSVSLVTKSDDSICSWYQLVSVVHQSVHDLALSSPSRPTVFVIVGDHQPPFDSPAERAQFSAKEVPYTLLIPKN